MSRLGFSGLDGDLQELVRRSAAIEPAPRGARGRVLAGVEAAVLSAGSGGGNPGGESLTSTRPSAVGRAAERGVAVAAGFVLGGALGALVTYEKMRPAAHADLPLAPSIAPSVATARVELALAPAMTASTAPTGGPADSARRESPTPAAFPSARVASAPSAPTDGLADERRLLDAARGAVEREDGASALTATAEHERKYPNGILAQEREAIAVRALLLLGRNAEARTRVSRFRATFPDSLLLPALESSVGAASAP
jgi:hypothetical protein